MRERIMRALSFRKGIYAEVKKDKTFTPTAWLIVILSALLTALGSNTSLVRSGRFVQWLLGVLGTTLFTVLGFLLASAAVHVIAKAVFDHHEKLDGLQRAFALSRVWMTFTLVGILTILSPSLSFFTGLVGLAAIALWFFSWVVSVREVFAMDWLPAIVLALIGFMVMLALAVTANTLLGGLGLMSTTLFKLFG